MRRTRGWVMVLLAALFALPVAAQDSDRAERIQKLKQELADVQAKQTELRGRLEELDEALKPENIERSLAGIGSTRPEELREHRRRMLTIEKDGVLKQLNTLEERRISLESAVAAVENAAYLESPQPLSAPSTQLFAAGNVERSRRIWFLIPAGIGLFFIIGAAGYLIVRRRSAERH